MRCWPDGPRRTNRGRHRLAGAGGLVPSIGLDWRIALLVVAAVALVMAVIRY
ncbi:MAG: hypothetical protein WAT36_07800 [Chromatiaceae bacterium]